MVNFGYDSLRAAEALRAVQTLRPAPATVLDVGAGIGGHSDVFDALGYQVTSVDAHPMFPGCVEWNIPGQEAPQGVRGERYDIVWCCHTLEHSNAPGAFLEALRDMLVPETGLLAITVPPMKPSIVGGHVTLWNAGLLLYNLILAGFDCSQASVRTYGYNVSVLVPRPSWEDAIELGDVLRTLVHDSGDIERLADYFPIPVRQGFDGNIEEVNWL